jgi:hypothetical protein
VDHFDGLSTWRGLFKSASGTITLDGARGTGTVDVLIDVSSIDLGHDTLNQMVVGAKIGEWNGLDVAHYPSAEYRGTLGGFVHGAPTTPSAAQARGVRGGRLRHLQPRRLRGERRPAVRFQTGGHLADPGGSDPAGLSAGVPVDGIALDAPSAPRRYFLDMSQRPVSTSRLWWWRTS